MEQIGKHAAAFRLLCFGLISVVGLAAGCSRETAAPQSDAHLGLSAHFVDANHRPIDDPSDPGYPRSHLRIQGQVYKGGVPVSQGAVDVNVVSTTYKFNQSMFLQLDNHGNFASPDDAFTSIHPGSEVTITAELNSSFGRESRTIELASGSPAKKWVAVIIILIVLVGMIAIFLFAFTGRARTGKNQLAIQFSYLVILLFLAVPIVAPVLLLRLFPAAVDAMIGYPAGLVVTRIGEPPHANAQWAINLGGYSHVCVDLCLDPAALAEQDKAAKAKADADAQATAQQAAAAKKDPSQTGPAPNSTPKAVDQKGLHTTPNSSSTGSQAARTSSVAAGKSQPPVPARKTAAPGTTITPASPNVPAITQPLSSSAPASAATTNQPAAYSDEGAISTADTASESDKGGVATRDSSPQAEPNLTDDLIHPERLDPPIVKVEGGLVIPLYVIVLSVIGGAINMTRKVPGFQKEGEDTPEIEPPSPAHPTTGTEEQTGEKKAAATQPDPNQPTADKAADDKAGAQTGAPDKLSLEDQAAKIDAVLDALIPAQVQRNTNTAAALPKMQALVTQMQNLFATNTNPTLRGYSNFDEWYVSRPRLREILGGSWRVELLNQYMYLISAPFLAIVTYYILDLLGLSKPGVIVVLSFSVGLISEKIVNWILGIAAGYMQTPKT
jgi:hypothetical protein